MTGIIALEYILRITQNVQIDKRKQAEHKSFEQRKGKTFPSS